MFTLEQINNANAKVKSGADFPHLVQDLIGLRVKTNDVFVCDGHAEYFGEDDFVVKSPPIYELLKISDESDAEKFKIT